MYNKIVFLFLICLGVTLGMIAQESSTLTTQLKQQEKIKFLIETTKTKIFAQNLWFYSLNTAAAYLLFKLYEFYKMYNDVPEVLASLSIILIPSYWAAFLSINNQKKLYQEQIEDLEEELKLLEAPAA
jgi:hypothetical protein